MHILHAGETGLYGPCSAPDAVTRVVTRLDFDTKEEFAQQIEDLVKLHAMNDAWNGIDPPSEHVRERFIDSGAGRFIDPLPIL